MDRGFGSPRFWLGLICFFATPRILVYGIRKKRLRLTMLLSCALIAAMVLGVVVSAGQSNRSSVLSRHATIPLSRISNRIGPSAAAIRR